MNALELAEYLGSTGQHELIYIDWLVNSNFEDGVYLGCLREVSEKLGITNFVIYTVNEKLKQKHMLKRLGVNRYQFKLENVGKAERLNDLKKNLLNNWGG